MTLFAFAGKSPFFVSGELARVEEAWDAIEENANHPKPHELA